MRPEDSRRRGTENNIQRDRNQRDIEIPRRRQGSQSRNASTRYDADRVAARKRKRKKKLVRTIGKVVPFVVALLLIAVIVGIVYGSKIVDKYSYSGEYADKNDYFEVFYDYQVALIINNEKMSEKGVHYKNTNYLSEEDVKKFFTDRFYINTDEQEIRYTTQDYIVKAKLNQSENFTYYVGEEARSLNSAPAITNDGKAYISVEYIKLFADFDVTYFDDPSRLVIYTEAKQLQTAKINKDTKVRYRGGVKSDILEDMTEGDIVYVLEELEDWAKVQTKSGYIGYVEIKRLDKGGMETVSLEPADIMLSYNPIKMNGKINMAFHQVFDANASDFTSDVTSTKALNVIAPTWFRFQDDEGNIKSVANGNYVNNAHNAGVQVWAVWTDVDNEVNLKSIFHSSEKRRLVIDTMISKTKEYGIDGINLDLEKIPSDAGEDWAEFLRELSIETHNAGIILSVDNYAPTASSVHYKRDVQGEVCDFVVVMGYDEHWATSSEAGSVASIGFVEDGIVNTNKCGVPMNKIINAVPFYTRVWKTKNGELSSDTFGIKGARNWCNENGIELNWNDETCQYYGYKENGDTIYQIWMEDEKSLEAKMSVMQSQGVAGVAEWKLGLEPENVWDVIAAYINS